MTNPYEMKLLENEKHFTLEENKHFGNNISKWYY